MAEQETELRKAQRLVRGLPRGAEVPQTEALQGMVENLNTELSRERWALLLELWSAAIRYRALLGKWDDLNEHDHETATELARRASADVGT